MQSRVRSFNQRLVNRRHTTPPDVLVNARDVIGARRDAGQGKR